MVRDIGPWAERTPSRSLTKLPDGHNISKAFLDSRFWHLVLGEFIDSPLRKAGDLILKTN